MDTTVSNELLIRFFRAQNVRSNTALHSKLNIKLGAICNKCKGSISLLQKQSFVFSILKFFAT